MFNWAFIGTGALAQRVAPMITGSGRHRIVSVYSRNPERRETFAKKHNAYAARDALEAISHPGVDGVYIVTPHTSHAEYARQAMELGKPVLCEKPVSTDARTVEELQRISKHTHVYFTEAMWTWFSPVSRQVKEWVDAGEYGDIQKVYMTYCMYAKAPRLLDPGLAGGALLDIGIYPLTYIYRLFGMPQEIACTGKIKNGIDVTETIRLKYPGDKEYILRVSIENPLGRDRMWILGTEGKTYLRGYYKASQVKLVRRHGLECTFHGNGNMLNEFDAVTREIQEGRTESQYVPHQATLDVMKLMDECRRQMNLVYPFEKSASN